MKARNRIADIRRQSRIAPSSENLWFFSDNNSDDQSTVAKRKSFRNDRSSILNNDYNRYSLDNSGRDNKTKECPFIVDWQMSDVF
ncbi:hypothetical protein [Aquipluma nitroreducens]|uniref:hypothetical protein n=1 Tax=Aquipluma nitroreducens TaxID=2010828 RepID=UPI00296ED3C7|nr:hypothetical protein [Aquipluma nitroreducens]